MAIGQFLLFISASTFDSSIGTAKVFMWSALFIIIFGNGFFKPNISSMVGSLYPKQEKDNLDSVWLRALSVISRPAICTSMPSR